MATQEELTVAALADEKTVEVVSKEQTSVEVNGVTFDIPRGESVSVPASVAALLADAGFID
jgi:hypothetical protein